LLQKRENSRHDLLIVSENMPLTKTSRNRNELILDLNAAQGIITTSEKSKIEIKTRCKHQDNCEQRRKVGRESLAIIANCAEERMDCPKQCRQIETYREKGMLWCHQSIYNPALPDIIIATSISSTMKL